LSFSFLNFPAQRKCTQEHDRASLYAPLDITSHTMKFENVSYRLPAC